MMRRKDREVTDWDEMIAIMRQCDVCRIALNDEGAPYILPLNFGMEVQDGRVELYFHGALSGRKYELMRRDPRVSFEMDRGHQLVMDTVHGTCSMAYESVIGQGRITLLPEEEKATALARIMRQYHEEAFAYNPAPLPATAVFKLTVERMTAKRRMAK